jgi:excisionase family DNA binding protein
MSKLFGYRVEEVAKELKVSVRTARRLLEKHNIPHTVMPGRYQQRAQFRISDASIELLKQRIAVDLANERERTDKGIGRHTVKNPRLLTARKLSDRRTEE